MRIFIIQHGDALPSDQDPERSLSEKGISQVNKLSRFLKKNSIFPDIIFHSNKKRAIETADIISKELGGIPLQSRDDLNPNDTPNNLASEIYTSNQSIMIIGHLPHLSKLAHQLVFPGTDKEIITLMNASPLILARKDNSFFIELFIMNNYI